MSNPWPILLFSGKPWLRRQWSIKAGPNTNRNKQTKTYMYDEYSHKACIKMTWNAVKFVIKKLYILDKALCFLTCFSTAYSMTFQKSDYQRAIFDWWKERKKKNRSGERDKIAWKLKHFALVNI